MNQIKNRNAVEYIKKGNIDNIDTKSTTKEGLKMVDTNNGNNKGGL